MVRVKVRARVRVRVIVSVVLFCVIFFMLYFSCCIFLYCIYILESEITLTTQNIDFTQETTEQLISEKGTCDKTTANN